MAQENKVAEMNPLKSTIDMDSQSVEKKDESSIIIDPQDEENEAEDMDDGEEDNEDDEEEKGPHSSVWSKVRSILSKIWNCTFGKLEGDWFFLALLGIIMAWVSLIVDYGIGVCIKSRLFLYQDLTTHPFFRYLAWIWLPLCLILFSFGFTRLLAPQAAGSGIPEMKTMLRGIVIKDHFSVKALIVKIIGLTATLGTGLPLGKEGPFVHISSMAAILLTKVISSFRGMYENKSRHSEMIAAACAVGVATAFAAPVGGVLFSIEVTAVHFAVRNYWRGFFAAVCATVMNRLLAVWFKDEETLTALFRTNFEAEFPYAPPELLVFALLGVLCGFLGALFVWLHRKYVLFKGRNKIMTYISNKNVFLYPFLVTLLYTSLTFPLGAGMFMASEISTHKQVTDLFSNFSWTKQTPTAHEFTIIKYWMSPHTGIFISLFGYFVFIFFGTILASTIGVPGGIFVPVFKLGAACGRIVGEAMSLIFPNGIQLGNFNPSILPGVYSIVGAAALAGSVTHTVSCSVIAFEMTGQLSFCIPVMIAVFISNGVAQALQPSIFDSIIKMKKFPFLPNIASTQSKAHYVFVEDFMIRDVKFIFYGITYKELKEILFENKKFRSFPIVDSQESMVLLGSASRKNLLEMLDEHLSMKRKKLHFYDWRKEALKYLEKYIEKADETILRSPEIEDLSKMEPSSSSSSINKSNSLWISMKNESSKTQFSRAGSSSPSVLQNMERRLSRFSVTKVEGPRPPKPIKFMTMPYSIDVNLSNNSTLTQEMRPKSILKATNSFIGETNRSVMKSKYATIHGGDARSLKNPFGSLRSKGSLKLENKTSSHLTFNFHGSPKEEELYKDILVEKIRTEESKWEEKELCKDVDFSHCEINPAPHQLVERSNLLQVHSIFSLLGLSHAYVTAIGRLIGVVTISQLRKIIEETNTEKIRKFSANKKSKKNNKKFS